MYLRPGSSRAPGTPCKRAASCGWPVLSLAGCKSQRRKESADQHGTSSPRCTPHTLRLMKGLFGAQRCRLDMVEAGLCRRGRSCEPGTLRMRLPPLQAGASLRHTLCEARDTISRERSDRDRTQGIGGVRGLGGEEGREGPLGWVGERWAKRRF